MVRHCTAWSNLFFDTLNWTFQNSSAPISEVSSDDEGLYEIKSSGKTIAEHFQAPLEVKGVNICS